MITLTLEDSQVHNVIRTAAPHMPIGPSGPIVYTELASFTNRMLSDGHEVGFITFNYDIGLDFALRSYGFEIDYQIDRHSPEEPTRRVHVCKLHGSLSWAPHSAGIHAFDVYKGVLQQLRATHEVGQREPYRLKTQVVTGGGTPCGEPSSIPFIVPPSDSKASMRKLIRPVWQRASELLRQAEVIAFVGYSMPETDSFFRHLFGNGMTGDTIVRQVWILDKDSGTCGRIEDLFSEGVRKDARVLKYPFTASQAIQGLVEEYDKVRKYL